MNCRPSNNRGTAYKMPLTRGGAHRKTNGKPERKSLEMRARNGTATPILQGTLGTHRVAWVSLDAADNSALRFWTYVLNLAMPLWKAGLCLPLRGWKVFPQQGDGGRSMILWNQHRRGKRG